MCIGCDLPRLPGIHHGHLVWPTSGGWQSGPTCWLDTWVSLHFGLKVVGTPLSWTLRRPKGGWVRPACGGAYARVATATVSLLRRRGAAGAQVGWCGGPCFAVHGIADTRRDPRGGSSQPSGTDPGMFQGCKTDRSWRSPLKPVRPEVSERIGVSGRR